jgi:hypothetical protein
MRTSTRRRAAQVATAVLAGAGALAVSASAASAAPSLATQAGPGPSASLNRPAASSTVRAGATVIDLGAELTVPELRVPVICCGNLGPLAQQLEDAFTVGAR